MSARALIVISWLIAQAACATGADAPQTPGFRQGVASADCAPWDGAAFSVTLSDPRVPDGPLLSLRVYQGVEATVGSTVRIDDATSTGSIGYCLTSGDCSFAEVGEVRITSFADTLRGSVDATWSDGRRVRTDFAAGWDPRVTLCGD